MKAPLICILFVVSFLSSSVSNSSRQGPSHQSLECHTCYSEKSWGDCHRNARVNKCPSFLNTCMKVHRTTRYPGGKAVHQFAKSCFARDMCKMSFCEQRATNESHVTCQDLSCCSTPLCNYGNPAKVRHSKSVGIMKLLKMEEVIKHESK